MKIDIFLKINLLFNSFYFVFVLNKTLRLNNLKTKTDMSVKIPVFVTCVKVIIYLLLYNLHECTFNEGSFNLIDFNLIVFFLRFRN